jgi:hypothetical protein
MGNIRSMSLLNSVVVFDLPRRRLFLGALFSLAGGALSVGCTDAERHKECERLGIPSASLESACIEPVEVQRACEIRLEKSPPNPAFSELPEGEVIAYDESGTETITEGRIYRSYERDDGATIVDALGRDGCVFFRTSTVEDRDEVIEHQRSIDSGDFYQPIPAPEMCMFARTTSDQKLVYADDDCSCEPGPLRSRISFDDAGRALNYETLTDGEWKTFRAYEYDEEGRILAEWRDGRDGLRLVREQSYDDQGRLSTRCSGDHCETFEYEPFEGGVRETIVTTSPSSEPRTTVRIISAEGLPLSQTSTQNSHTFTKTWEWSADGLLLGSSAGQEGSAPVVLRHEYDDDGRLVSTDDTYGSDMFPLTRVFEYDAAGFVTRRTDRGGDSEIRCEVTFDYEGSCEPIVPTAVLPAPLVSVTGFLYSDCMPYLD